MHRVTDEQQSFSFRPRGRMTEFPDDLNLAPSTPGRHRIPENKSSLPPGSVHRGWKTIASAPFSKSVGFREKRKLHGTLEASLLSSRKISRRGGRLSQESSTSPLFIHPP
ncbi:hypothetical protein AVEN_89077-1 [Araneus ventricosus]|uniref:Uncharacterized protein n=1 Tax=Araneus ventricosus TaxID=182803 RepID=A0A4Y2B3H1_ARAVE|nr:hypothetical protein AVEN_89077-1 [Araneus ventricosus]